MKKHIITSLIGITILFCVSSVFATSSCATLYSSINSDKWKQNAQGNYLFNGGGGTSNAKLPGLTCTPYPGLSTGYAMFGVNGVVNRGFNTGLPFTLAVCESYLTQTLIPELGCSHQPAKWVSISASTYSIGTDHCRYGLTPGVGYALMVNSKMCPNQSDKFSRTACTQCYYSLNSNST